MFFFFLKFPRPPVGLCDNPSDIVSDLERMNVELGHEPHFDALQVNGHAATHATAALNKGRRVRQVVIHHPVHDGLHVEQLVWEVLGFGGG